MGKFLKELFEQYARRLLTTKVRPSISEEGIMTIPNNKRVEKMAVSLYEDFQKAGVPDNILKTENDIKVFHHKIAEINNENMAKQFDTLISESTLFNPKKPADVFDLKGNKIKNTDNIMGGEEIKELDPALYEDRGGNIIPAQFKNETEEQIKKRLMDQNKKSLDSMKKKLDEPDDMATGGRAGYYGGGQAMVGKDLSDIGHGSDALMARNMQVAPGGQATTSTGLNYLLGQDNDTVRIPYNEGKKVEGPNPKVLELMLNEKMSYPDALKELKIREKQQPYIDQRYNMGPGPILEAAEGGPARVPYKDAGPVVLPKPKPTNDFKSLLKIYNTYKDSMPGVSEDTQKYLAQDFINKLNEKGLSQTQFQTLRMQNHYEESKAEGGRIDYNQGGPARQGFKMGKRAFLKFLGAGAAGIASLKTGLLGFGKEGGKKVAKEVAKEVATGGPPPHFLKLVAKIKALGDDVTQFGALTERQTVKKYKDFEMTTDNTTGQIEIQRVKVAEDMDYYGSPVTEESYMGYKPGEVIDDAKGIKSSPDYQEGTTYLRNDGPETGSVLDEMSGLSDDIYEEVGEVVPEAIRKEKADGGRIGYAGGKKVFDVTAKKIKNKLGKNAGKTEIPKETLLRDMFNKSNTRLNDKKMMNADELEDFEMEIGDALEGYDFDGTIGDANRILREQKRYTSEMLGEYMSIGGSKRPGGPNDAMADAIENASPGYTGDLKYDANILADDLAENRFGKEFDRLSQKQQMDLYDEAYKALAENKRTFTEMQNLSRPKKTLEGIKKTGVIDISDPDIAEEFTKFMKEKNPKGFTDMEQKIQLESFDPKKTKGNAEGGRIV
jgi:hypothetical protein